MYWKNKILIIKKIRFDRVSTYARQAVFGELKALNIFLTFVDFKMLLLAMAK